MPIYRHMMVHESISGQAADRAVNVFHSLSVDDAAAQVFAEDLVDLVGNAAPGALRNLQEYLGGSISRVGQPHQVRVYDLADPTPRVPVAIVPFGATAPVNGSSPMVREAAVCLSFQGEPLSGTPQARRRGRVFWGPLNTAAATSDVPTGDLRPSAQFITDAVAALEDFHANHPLEWVVYSPTFGTTAAVTNGWIDNAFDTQRRRGVDPTTKTLWTQATVAKQRGSRVDVLAVQGRLDGMYDAVVVRRIGSGEEEREVWRDLTEADIPLLLRTVAEQVAVRSRLLFLPASPSSANTWAEIYSVPGGRTARFSWLSVVNITAAAQTVFLGIDSPFSPLTAFWEDIVPAQTTRLLGGGLVLDEDHELWLYASSVNVIVTGAGSLLLGVGT